MQSKPVEVKQTQREVRRRRSAETEAIKTLHASSVNAINAAKRRFKDTPPWQSDVITDFFQRRVLEREVTQRLGNNFESIRLVLIRHPESCALLRVDIVRNNKGLLNPWHVSGLKYEGTDDVAVNRIWHEIKTRPHERDDSRATYFVCYCMTKGHLGSAVISDAWLTQSLADAAKAKAEAYRAEDMLSRVAAQLDAADEAVSKAAQQEAETARSVEEAQKKSAEALQVATEAAQTANSAKTATAEAAAKAQEAERAAEQAAAR
jgi:hypothetical protein